LKRMFVHTSMQKQTPTKYVFL